MYTILIFSASVFRQSSLIASNEISLLHSVSVSHDSLGLPYSEVEKQ